MKNIRKYTIILLVFALSLLLSACSLPFVGEIGGNDDENTIETYYTADTTVSYSSGSDSNWSYGNQRKEFPQNESCYVRIGTTAVTPKRKTAGTEITVTYRFTGAINCKVEISDGIATKHSIDDNVVEFTRTVSAEKAKKATEDVVIFQYSPTSNTDSVVVEVTYDEHVAPKYDVRNTIYFSAAKENHQNN